MFKINDPDVVTGCRNRQGEGPLYFFVPVTGGAVRVAVCQEHADLLEHQYSGEGGESAGG